MTRADRYRVRVHVSGLNAPIQGSVVAGFYANLRVTAASESQASGAAIACIRESVKYQELLRAAGGTAVPRFEIDDLELLPGDAREPDGLVGGLVLYEADSSELS